tara:strand:+ start:440 stop:637 length:198 start_codon:yes stop_codon:yes gene_type:complete
MKPKMKNSQIDENQSQTFELEITGTLEVHLTDSSALRKTSGKSSQDLGHHLGPWHKTYMIQQTQR